MKKKKFAKRSWQILIVLTLVLLLGSGAGLLWSYNAPLEVSEEYTAYSYRQESVVDYNVHLLPNSFFNETVLEAGRAYITELTDYISTDFTYRFAGNGEEEINGEYSVVATLTAYTGKEGHKVFEKTSELLPPQSFTATNNVVSFQESVIVPFQEYLEFATRLREETRFNPDELSLSVKYNVTIAAETEQGVVRDQFAPSMEISLKGNTFVVTGNLTEEKTDSIPATRKVSFSLIEQARKVFSVSTISLAGFLLYFSLLITPKEQKINCQEKEVSLILKKYGDRIAVSKSGVPEVSNKVILINSFEDIVKIADELGKPILYYQAGTESICRHSFLVLSEERDYMYHVEVRLLPATVVGDTRQELRPSVRRGG